MILYKRVVGLLAVTVASNVPSILGQLRVKSSHIKEDKGDSSLTERSAGHVGRRLVADPANGDAPIESRGRQLQAVGDPDIGETRYENDQECMQDVAGFNLGCTANDVSLAEATNLTFNGEECIGADPPCTCILDDMVTFTARFKVVLTAQARHDVGIYFSQDGDGASTAGGDGALTGNCTIATLPYAPDQPWLDLDGTNDPEAGNNKASAVQDTCGDIDSDHNPLYPVVTLTVPCVPSSTNELELPYCTSWRQPGANDLCTNVTDAFPGSPSKCRCDLGFSVPILVCNDGPDANISPACPGASNTYSLDPLNINGDLSGRTCQWTFVGGGDTINTTVADCSVASIDDVRSDVGLSTGSYNVSLTIDRTGTVCSVTANVGTITLNPPLTVVPSLTERCFGQFGYNATFSGGDGDYEGIVWTFSGGTNGTSTTQSGVFPDTPTPNEGTYTAAVTVMDGKGCTATDSDTVEVYDEIIPTATVTGSCADQFTYSGSAPGGDSPSYEWTYTVDGGLPVDGVTQLAGDTVTLPAQTCVNSAPPRAVSVTLVATDSRPLLDQMYACDPANDTANTTVYSPIVIDDVELTGSCEDTADYEATVCGGNGDYTFDWDFLEDGISFDMSTMEDGTVELTDPSSTCPRPPRPVTATLTVSDSSECTAVTAADTDTVYSPILVDNPPTLTGSCDGTFEYDVFACGGVEPLSYSWTFSSPGESIQPSSERNGTIDLGIDADCNGSGRLPRTISASVEVTSSTGVGLPTCVAPNPTADDATVYSPIRIEGALMTGFCNDTFSFGADRVCGGAAPLSYSWYFKTHPDVNGYPVTVSGLEGTDRFVANVLNDDSRVERNVTGKLTVSSAFCDDEDTEEWTLVRSPLELDLSSSDTGGTCPIINNDTLSVTPRWSGGSGTYALVYDAVPGFVDILACDTGASGVTTTVLETTCTWDPENDEFCREGRYFFYVEDKDTGHPSCPSTIGDPDYWMFDKKTTTNGQPYTPPPP